MTFDCEICGAEDKGGGIGGWGVHMELWNDVMFKHGASEDKLGIAKGMLCMGCFEKRLGRKLVKEDFTDTGDNHTNKIVQDIINGRL